MSGEEGRERGKGTNSFVLIYLDRERGKGTEGKPDVEVEPREKGRDCSRQWPGKKRRVVPSHIMGGKVRKASIIASVLVQGGIVNFLAGKKLGKKKGHTSHLRGDADDQIGSSFFVGKSSILLLKLGRERMVGFIH